MRRPDPRRGGVLRGLLFSIVAIVVLIVAGAAFVAQRIRVTTLQSAAGEDVSIDTPGGKIKIRTHDHGAPVLAGVPVYPGATRTKDGGGASFEWRSDDGKSDKEFAVEGTDLVTPDHLDKVLAWYRGQLPDWILSADHDGSTKFERKEGGYRRFIALKQKSDGTHIGVASVGEPASN